MLYRVSIYKQSVVLNCSSNLKLGVSLMSDCCYTSVNLGFNYLRMFLANDAFQYFLVHLLTNVIKTFFIVVFNYVSTNFPRLFSFLFDCFRYHPQTVK